MKSRLLVAGVAAAMLACAPAFASPPPSAPAPSTAAAKAPAAHAVSPQEGLYRRAQEKLKGMGFYNGQVDGVRSPATVSALERFQREHHIRATGRLTHETQRALGLRT